MFSREDDRQAQAKAKSGGKGVHGGSAKMQKGRKCGGVQVSVLFLPVPTVPPSTDH